MAATELALLRVLHPSSDNTIPPSLLNKLTHAASAQATFSKVPVAMFQCIEDPSLIYLIGGWASVDVHMNDWIPGAENQELLKLLADDLGVEWVQHIDVDPSLVFGENIANAKGGVNGVVAMSRHFLKEGGDVRAGFEPVFARNRRYFEEDIGSGRVAGGCRVDKERRESGGEKEEFVLFSGWESVDEHLDFGKSEKFHRYAGIRDFLEGADVKHGKRILITLPGAEP